MNVRLQTNDRIIRHVQGLRLPSDGVKYVGLALKAPSRLVGQTRHPSVATRFASTKLKQVVQAESHTCELPFLHAQELDQDVLACMDQPPPLFVESIDKRGRRHRNKKTPDFLVIRSGSVEIVECKTHGELQKLVATQPHNWIVEGDTYRYLPGEAPAAALGMRFRVHDARTISAIQAENMRILIYTQRSNVAPLENRLLDKAIRILVRNNGLSLSELATELKIECLSPIIASVLQGDLYVLMRWQLLSAPDSTTVYPSKEYMGLAERALRVTAEEDCLRTENYAAPMALSEKALGCVIEQMARIRRIRAGELKPTRTDYRYLRKLREGEASGLSPLMALAPQFHLRGNKSCLPQVIEDALQEEISTHHASAVRWSISAVARSVNERLKPLGHAISYETVRQRVKAYGRSKLAREREGYRAENAVRPPVDVDQRALRASLPWECAHVDSTVLDEKVWLQTGLANILARPTIYLLIDESESYILAYWICFGSSGDQAVACLFRECIRKHGRLPRCIVHDQGSEFFSRFSEMFSAATGVDLIRRPKSAPRFGAQVESAFNRLNQLIIHRLPGNTQNDKLGRAATTDKRSAAHARQDLLVFLETTEEGLVGYLNDRPLGNRIASPTELFDRKQKQYSGIAKMIELTPDILAQTAIPPRDERPRLIDSARGIKYMHRRYVGPGIKDSSLHGTKVPIRWEPYNPCIIYAQVRGRWERLTCQGYQELEHAGHYPRLIELYMRYDTARASKAAKDRADYKMARRLREQLEYTTKPPPKPLKEVAQDAASMASELFTHARDLNLDGSTAGEESP